MDMLSPQKRKRHRALLGSSGTGKPVIPITIDLENDDEDHDLEVVATTTASSAIPKSESQHAASSALSSLPSTSSSLTTPTRRQGSFRHSTPSSPPPKPAALLSQQSGQTVQQLRNILQHVRSELYALERLVSGEPRHFDGLDCTLQVSWASTLAQYCLPLKRALFFMNVACIINLDCSSLHLDPLRTKCERKL
jgi:hypothetical protein